MTSKKGQKFWSMKGVRIFISIISAILTSWLVVYGLNYKFGEWRNSNKSVANEAIKDVSSKTPTLEFAWKPVIDYEKNQIKFMIEATWKDSVYLTGAWNEIIMQPKFTNENGEIIKNISVPDIVKNWEKATIEVSLDDFNWWKIQWTIECQYNGKVTFADWKKPSCDSKWVNLSLELIIPNYKWLTIVWVDATYKNDNITLWTAWKFFKDKGAKFYWVQSSWIKKWEWVVRIDGKNILPRQKTLFAFYNNKFASNQDFQDDLKNNLAWLFTHLDNVELYSFEDINHYLDKRTEDNSIRTIFYWIGDCLQKDIGCWDLKLNNNNHNYLFSKEMLNRNDIDVLFFVPATTETKIIKVNN